MVYGWCIHTSMVHQPTYNWGGNLLHHKPNPYWSDSKELGLQPAPRPLFWEGEGPRPSKLSKDATLPEKEPGTRRIRRLYNAKCTA